MAQCRWSKLQKKPQTISWLHSWECDEKPLFLQFPSINERKKTARVPGSADMNVTANSCRVQSIQTWWITVVVDSAVRTLWRGRGGREPIRTSRATQPCCKISCKDVCTVYRSMKQTIFSWLCICKTCHNENAVSDGYILLLLWYLQSLLSVYNC